MQLSVLDKGWEFLQALAVHSKEHELIGAFILEIMRVYSSLTNYLLQIEDIVSFNLFNQDLLNKSKVVSHNSIETTKGRANVFSGLNGH